MQSLLIIHRKSPGKNGPIDKNLRVAQGYRYFTQQAKKQNINVFVAHYKRCTKDIDIKPGYQWKGQQWVPFSGSMEPDYILNHTPIYLDEELLRALSRKTLVFINAPDFQQFVADKWRTYKSFADLVPRTARTFRPDLTKNSRCIVKPRKGAGGEGVRAVHRRDYPIETAKNELVQSFIDTSSGIVFQDRAIKGAHDLRVFVLNGNVIGTFLRLSQQGVIANISQGGQVINASVEELPNYILERIQLIDEKLRQYSPRFYAADFGIGANDRPWLFEIALL